MSRDRLGAVLAGLFVLVFVSGARTAGATDVPGAAAIGAGIDHASGTRASVVPGQVSAADAIELLNRNGQPASARQAPRGSGLSPMGELRGLLAQDGVYGGPSALLAKPSGPGWTPARRANRAAPYARISEYERVLGVSFKIQPPQQTPEPTSPGL